MLRRRPGLFLKEAPLLFYLSFLFSTKLMQPFPDLMMGRGGGRAGRSFFAFHFHFFCLLLYI